MDIFVGTNFKFQDLKPPEIKVLAIRITLVVLNLLSLILVVAVKIMMSYFQISGFVSSLGIRLPMSSLWIWIFLCSVELILCASGVFLYFMGKFGSKDEDTWNIMYSIYYIFQTHVILYALVQGCHDIFILRSVIWPSYPKFFNVTIAASVICLLNAILHFIAGFFPGPNPKISRAGPEGAVNSEQKDDDNMPEMKDVMNEDSGSIYGSLNDSTVMSGSDVPAVKKDK